MQEELLRMEQVFYRYPGEKTDALRNCSLTIRQKEKIAVLGGNGAGKSTLFLLVNGVIRPGKGTLSFCGKIVKTERDLYALRQGVGLVFQDPDVQILAGTVWEEVAFGPANLGFAPEKIQSAVKEALTALNLQNYAGRAPQYLSGGEKKRVTIADVLAMHPRLMLLDEPASSLDPQGRQELENRLDLLHHAGMALLVATHDLDFAWRWADRILVFREGQLAADGAPEEIFADDALLKACGLEKPFLYQVGEILGIEPPRSIGELRERKRSGHIP